MEHQSAAGGALPALANGRLVVPCDHVETALDYSVSLHSHVLLSDDGGETWFVGGVASFLTNECQVAELIDGTLELNMRSWSGWNVRVVQDSVDGGFSWSAPRYDQQLPEPAMHGCQAAILAVDLRAVPCAGTSVGAGLLNAQSLVFFSNPKDSHRQRLTVRVRVDKFAWEPCELVLHEGPAAYSCMQWLPGSSSSLLACLFEAGQRSPYEEIRLALVELGVWDEIRSDVAGDAGVAVSGNHNQARDFALLDPSPVGVVHVPVPDALRRVEIPSEVPGMVGDGSGGVVAVILGSARGLSAAYLVSPGDLVVYVCEYKRSPRRFVECLQGDQTLKDCATALRCGGYDLPEKAKIFLYPSDYELVKDYLRNHGVLFPCGKCIYYRDLEARHVVVDARLMLNVERALGGIPAREQVTEMRRAVLILRR